MDGKNQGSYLGSIYKNDKVIFHVNSEIAQKASLNMIACSNYVLNYDASGNPKETLLDIDLKVGDNTIVLEFQCPNYPCPTHPWGGNADMTINIDKIIVDYLI